MNELTIFVHNGVEVVDSREVSKVVERSHNELLKTIRTYCSYLEEGEIPQVKFFIESTYCGPNNQTYPNYLITKKGCDMIANKTTGKKGVLFTAAYVTAFEKMRERLTRAPAIPPTVSPGGLARLIGTTRRVMLDMGCTAWDVGADGTVGLQRLECAAAHVLCQTAPGTVFHLGAGEAGRGWTAISTRPWDTIMVSPGPLSFHSTPRRPSPPSPRPIPSHSPHRTPSRPRRCRPSRRWGGLRAGG